MNLIYVRYPLSFSLTPLQSNFTGKIANILEKMRNQQQPKQFWSHRQVELLDFGKDLQKEENPSLMSRGRGRVNGGNTSCELEMRLSLLAKRGSASAGCCLLRPSMINANVPKVRQPWIRDCGAPERGVKEMSQDMLNKSHRYSQVE